MTKSQSFLKRIKRILTILRRKLFKRLLQGFLLSPGQEGFRFRLNHVLRLLSAPRIRSLPKNSASGHRVRPHGYEPLEYRMLLAADLQLPSGLTSEEIVLSYSTSASQYQLLQNGIVVSTATAASASSGGVRISGNAADNSLKLDIARLPAVAITLLGNGQDRLAIMDDSNMTVHSDRVIVGSKTYPIAGFERLELSGGP